MKKIFLFFSFLFSLFVVTSCTSKNIDMEEFHNKKTDSVLVFNIEYLEEDPERIYETVNYYLCSGGACYEIYALNLDGKTQVKTEEKTWTYVKQTNWIIIGGFSTFEKEKNGVYIQHNYKNIRIKHVKTITTDELKNILEGLK